MAGSQGVGRCLQQLMWNEQTPGASDGDDVTNRIENREDVVSVVWGRGGGERLGTTGETTGAKPRASLRRRARRHWLPRSHRVCNALIHMM